MTAILINDAFIRNKKLRKQNKNFSEIIGKSHEGHYSRTNGQLRGFFLPERDRKEVIGTLYIR